MQRCLPTDARCALLPQGVVEPSDDVLWVLRQQRLWSKSASLRKASIQRWRTIALALVVTGAVLATISAQIAGVSSGAGRLLGGAAAVAVGLVPVIRGRKLDRASVRAWTRARSVSEGLKSELYRYLASAGEHAGGHEEAKLRLACEDIVARASDLAAGLVGIDPGELRLPPVDDVPSYVEHRVQEQIDGFYRPKAAQAEYRLRLAREAEFVASLAAAGLGALAAIDGFGAAAWLPVATTIAAALVAHTAAAHYEDELFGYTTTVTRLESVRDDWRRRTKDGPDPEADSALVSAAEEAISVENKGWMAKWQSDDG